MDERNERIIRFGQSEMPHYCDMCCRVFVDGDGRKHYTEVVVTDGLTMGHCCCTVFRCMEPLQNNQDRFCKTHFDKHDECAVVGCTAPVVKDPEKKKKPSKVCSDLLHREMEQLNSQRSEAHFQLTARLQRQRVSHPNDTFSPQDVAALVDLEDSEEWFEIGDDGSVHLFVVPDPGATGVSDNPAIPCPSKPDAGNRKLKALFGRRRTPTTSKLLFVHVA